MSGLDPDDARPPFEQLADAMRTRIRSGLLAPGAQLPSYHALAQEFGVAPNTVKSAMAVLRSEGLIVSRQGKGSFVRVQPAVPPNETAGNGRTLEDVWPTLDAMNRRLEALERQLRAVRDGA
ncbi:hypothetical protein BJF78_34120 [Pseudonocardia sp. CNS-139]|nr:hypothetical protein BJF78_34120 [Pseudonocardia sp. CNS-139]